MADRELVEEEIEGKHEEQSPKRCRLPGNQDADNYRAYSSDTGPYGIGCAERDCFGSFGKKCHTQQTKNDESGVPHNGFVACGETRFPLQAKPPLSTLRLRREKSK